MTQTRARITFYVIFVCTLCWMYAYISINVLHYHGWSLYVLLPFVLGAGSTIIHGHPNQMAKACIRSTTWLTLFIYFIGMLMMGWDNRAWLFLSVPLLMTCTWLGFLAGNKYLETRLRTELSMSLILLFLLVPAFNAWENIHRSATRRPVVHKMEIHAAPVDVWNLLVEEELADSRKATAAEVRHMTLADSVLFAERSQYQLTPQPSGNTILMHTSWYSHSARPYLYWNFMADQVLQVYQEYRLRHFRDRAEHPLH